MGFQYNPNLLSDADLVRFHIGDTKQQGAYLDNETIDALLTSEGSVGGAVVACIKYIITQLSVPNFRQDWLQVDYQTAREAFEKLLKTKLSEFGISSGVTAKSSIALPYRRDSLQYTTSTRTDATVDNTHSYDGT